ncbi:MAG: lipid carrier--UDP-N-acetylgalactosaminyltransferase [Hydrococcus sp. SU_1_0]|nr:lipid carrier--UDP-N-acetylgalactosaminyltransferase [Hydrococcus sp. SU_1_0]
MSNPIKQASHDSSLKAIMESVILKDDIRSTKTINFLLKRTIDLLLSSILLLFATIPLCIVILLIKIDSPGTIFFSQTRIGLQGKPFKLLKLRTMVENASKLQTSLESSNEMEGEVLFKIRQDPRITRVGKYLRRYSIDEIPQLINVLKGDMSLVGPRPLTLRDSAKLPADQLIRHEVLPGITGFWQVSGRSETSSEHLGECDRFYVKKWSLGLDLFILLKTVFVVLAGEGAY